jgi:hypothetical protein
MQAHCAMKTHSGCQACPPPEHAQHGYTAARHRTPGFRGKGAQLSKSAFAFLTGSAILAATAEHALAFDSDPSYPDTGRGIHQNITQEALGFLKSEFRDFLADENRLTDQQTGLSPSWHFDNCYFRQTIKWHINGSAGDGSGTSYGYRAVKSEFQSWFNNPNRVASGLYGHSGQVFERYGELLHPIQDFYAHSNWPELGVAGYLPESALFDTGLGEWWEPTQDYQQHPTFPQVVVAQGEASAVPSGWTVSYLQGPDATARGKIMRIQANGVEKGGLISGVAGDGPDEAHDDVYWWHSDQSSTSYPLRWRGVNKDDSSRLCYTQAVNLALLQTTHEWDRLVSLIRAQNGDAGVQALENATINYQSSIYLNSSSDVNYELGPASFPTPNGSSAQPFRTFSIARRVIPASGATMFIQANTYAVGSRLGNPGQPLRLEKWSGSGNVRIEK